MSLISEDRLLGHLDRLHELREGHTSAPVNVEIDLSNRCSLGCEWCHFAYTHTRGPLRGAEKPEGAVLGGDLMDTGLALRLPAELARAGVRSLTWTGGGEPTLHPGFDLIVDHDVLPQGLYTHGGHINEERAALLKRRMTFVYVSLDAATDADYRRRKGVDRFAAACGGIRNLAAAAGDAKVGVGYLVGPDTALDEIPAAVDLAETLGADYVQFRPIIHFHVKTPGEAETDPGWIDPALEAIEKARYYRPGIVEFDPARFAAYKTWRGHGYPVCWWSGLQTVITPNGKVWTCVNLREHPGHEVGDLTRESFPHLWSRQKLAQVGPGCRVMCRGHMANLAAEKILARREHGMFV